MATRPTPISRDLPLRLAAYGGTLAAVLAAAPADPFTAVCGAVLVGAMAWSLALESRRPRWFLPSGAKAGLIVLGSALLLFGLARDGDLGRGAVAGALVRFMIWNAAVFALSRGKTESDLWTVAVVQLSCYMLAALAPAGARSAWFLPLLAAGVAGFVAAFHRASLLRTGVPARSAPAGIRLVGLTFALALAFALPAFIFFPRPGPARGNLPAPAAPVPRTLPLAVSGVEPPSHPPTVFPVAPSSGLPDDPDAVDLARLEPLRLDPTPVLEVRLTDAVGRPVPPDRSPYLRAAVLETYEDGAWLAAFRPRTVRDADDGAVDGWTRLGPAPGPGRDLVRQEIRLLLPQGDLIPTAPDPVRLRAESARWDPAGVVRFTRIPDGAVGYSVESALPPADPPADPGAGPAPNGCLRVPPGLDRTADFAHRIGGDPAASRAAVVQRLVRHLRRGGFEYTLDPFVPPPGTDPVEHFLETRRGLCVHFVTAMVLACRSVGIPARVAAGFRIQGPPGPGGTVVRNSDAHAWAEVWYGAGHGWIPCDPTPDGGPPAADAGGDAAAAATTGETEGEDVWDRFRIGSGAGEAAAAALRAAGAVVGAVVRALAAPTAAITVASLAAAAALAWFLIPPARRVRLRRALARGRAPSSVDFYADLLWVLARRGFRKPAAATAREFARAARLRFGEPGIDYVTDRFEKTLYRGVPPGPDERREIDRIIGRLLRIRPKITN